MNWELLATSRDPNNLREWLRILIEDGSGTKISRGDWFGYFPTGAQREAFLEDACRHGYELGDRPQPLWFSEDGEYWFAIGKPRPGTIKTDNECLRVFESDEEIVKSLVALHGGTFDGPEITVDTAVTT